MTLNSLITKLLQSRSAALWKGVSKRKSEDNFSVPMGRLRQFIVSYPEDTPTARAKFFGSVYYRDAQFCAAGRAGKALMESINKLNQQ